MFGLKLGDRSNFHPFEVGGRGSRKNITKTLMTISNWSPFGFHGLKRNIHVRDSAWALDLFYCSVKILWSLRG